MTTSQFIALNADGDVRLLALQASRYPEVNMPFALNQIAGRQTARRKLPSWAAVDGIVYPPHLSMEQCSGEHSARYKAALAGRLCPRGGSFADITGGFGVDFSFMARRFSTAVYIERQEHLCRMAEANFPLLGVKADVVCADGIDRLRQMPRQDLVFADPARRDSAGGRTYSIADCTPDVLLHRDLLIEKAGRVIIKLSPMLDWRKTAADFGPCVSEVHIVSSAGECKELLVVLEGRGADGVPERAAGRLPDVYCVNDSSVVVFPSAGELCREDPSFPREQLSFPREQPSFPREEPLSSREQLVGKYLYEPNASVMKSGCFGQLSRRYGVCKIGANSNLFASGVAVSDFPGRAFVVDFVTTMNKKDLKRSLAGISKANITVRNFPITVAELRRRLKMAEGGDVYIFATTLAGGSHVLIGGRKVGRGF